MNAKLQTALLHSTTRALFDNDLVVARMVIALAEWFWFVLLLWPGESMVRPIYTGMGYVMPEHFWTGLFFIFAVAQTAILLTESYHTPFAKFFSAADSMLWVFIVFAMLLSVSPPPASIGGDISIALASVWIWMRPYIILEGLSRARAKHPR